MGISFGDGRWYDNEYEQVADSHQLTNSPNYDPKTDVYQAPEQSNEPKDIHIIRHGETEDNEEDLVRGHKDVPLNTTGRGQALEAAEKLRSKDLDVLVTSDLSRAKDTANIIGKQLGVPVTVNDKLRTWNVGEFEGKPCAEYNPKLDDFVANKPDEKVPGGESFNEFKDRSFEGIREAIQQNPGKNIGIVAHNRVAATLRAWDKTGQDNPDTDPKEVAKETEKPGSVKTMTIEPDSTIMKGKDVLPFQQEAHTYLKKFRDALVEHVMTQSGNLKESLLDILRHPENMIGPQEGMFVAPSLGKRLFAQGLLKQGLSSGEVKALTGVERGAEGMLREEISDLPSSIKAIPDFTGKNKLSQIFDHPDLYKVYPDLKDVRIQYSSTLGKNTDARMYFEGNTIQLNPSLTDPMDIHDAILHEVQHWIQNQEGFALNVPSDAPESFVKEFAARMRKEGIKESPKERIYRQLASEVEARNTQKRVAMTELERRVSLGQETEDIPRSHQLIFDEKGNRLEASPNMSMPSGRLLQERYLEGIQKQLNAGKSFSEIGKALKVSRDAIAGLVKRNNLKASRPPDKARTGVNRTPLLDPDFDLE